MKVSLEISDANFRRAKLLATSRGISVREFITEAVEEALAVHEKNAQKPWVKLAGGLKHLHKQTERIDRIIEEEFEKG